MPPNALDARVVTPVRALPQQALPASWPHRGKTGRPDPAGPAGLPAGQRQDAMARSSDLGGWQPASSGPAQRAGQLAWAGLTHAYRAVEPHLQAPMGPLRAAAAALAVAVVAAPLAAPIMAALCGSALTPTFAVAVAGQAGAALTLGTSAMTLALSLPAALPYLRCFVSQYVDAVVPPAGEGMPILSQKLAHMYQSGAMLAAALAFGANFAPLIGAAALPGAALVAAAAGPMALAGLYMQHRAVLQSEIGSPKLSVQAATSFGIGTAVSTWSFLGGAVAPVAVQAGLLLASATLIGSVTVGLLGSGDLFRLPTAFADAHVVPERQDRPPARLQADPDGPQTVFGTPDALEERLVELAQKARRDSEGRIYWPGQPIMNWLTVEGAGQTSHARAVARILGADLLHLTGAQLRTLEAPGFTQVGVDYLLTVWYQAEERALKVGKPQVILIEDCQLLFPLPVGVTRGQRAAGLQKLARLVAQLGMLNPSRHRTVLIFTGEDDGAGNGVRMLLSPKQAVAFEPLTMMDRRRILDAAVERLRLWSQEAQLTLPVHFWSSEPLDGVLMRLAACDVSGRLLENTIEAGKRAAITPNMSEQDVQAALLGKLREQAEAVEALVASRAVVPKAAQAGGQANNALVQMLEHFTNAPLELALEAAASGKQYLQASLYPGRVAKARYINAMFSQMDKIAVAKGITGARGVERADYVAAWYAAAQKSSGFPNAPVSAFNAAYVGDAMFCVVDSLSAVAVGCLMLEREAEVKEEAGDPLMESFTGRTQIHPLLGQLQKLDISL